MVAAGADDGPAADVGRTRWVRLIPVAIIVYVISFMDRTNIGFAFGGLGSELHIDKAQQGLAGGVFFIGYLVLQIPSAGSSGPTSAATSRTPPAAASCPPPWCWGRRCSSAAWS
jgi:hypothetical protein